MTKSTFSAERDIVPPKYDVVFKKLFTENVDLLHDFISCALSIPSDSIKDIKFTNIEMPPDDVDGKFARLDLNMEIDDKLVNLEIQLNSEPYIRDRTLFYCSKLFTSSLKSGANYDQIKQAITINIINFNIFDSGSYHSAVQPIVKETGEVFSDKFQMHFFELLKVDGNIEKNNGMKLWLQFFKAESKEELTMISQTDNPVMQKACNVIIDMSEDAQIKEMARLREKWEHDKVSALEGAFNEGISKGKAEGIAEGINQAMALMKAGGMSEEEISKIFNTPLS